MDGEGDRRRIFSRTSDGLISRVAAELVDAIVGSLKLIIALANDQAGACLARGLNRKDPNAAVQFAFHNRRKPTFIHADLDRF